MVCQWFLNMDKRAKALFITRASWVLSFAILWIGLLPKGWEVVKLGSRKAEYGLWNIQYTGSSTFVSNYLDWESVQPSEVAYSRIQGTRACVVFCFAGNVLQFFAGLRLWVAKDPNVVRQYSMFTAVFGLVTFAFTILSLIVWKSIPTMAFQVFCSHSGCTSYPTSDGFEHNPSYSWGFFVIKAIFEAPGVVSLWILASQNLGSMTLPTYRGGSGTTSTAASAPPQPSAPAAVAEAPEVEDPDDPWSKKKVATTQQPSKTESSSPKNETSHATTSLGATGNPTPSWLNP